MSQEQDGNAEARQFQEDLVAYLDDELDAKGAARVEQRLVQDPAARRDVQRLEQVWDALDHLPRTTARETFTHATIELVAQTAQQEIVTSAKKTPNRKLWVWAGWLAAGAVVFALGLSFGRGRNPDPNRVLIEDLPLLDKLEPYRTAGSLELLEELDRQGLFAEEAAHARKP